MTQLLKYWQLVRSSFWFVPTLMTGAAVALASGMVWVDRAKSDDLHDRLGFAYTGGAEGASLVLSTIAGSMITIAAWSSP